MRYFRGLFKLTFILFIILANQSALAHSKHVIINSKIEWQTPSAGFLTDDPFTPICHFNNNTYTVWVDGKFRPWVTKISNGKVTTSPLDANPDYLAQADGHHRFSIGVDPAGFLHITGDMHNYGVDTASVITPYPLRYQKQQILYWKSNAPDSIAAGFTFAGGLNSASAIPGTGWLLGKFFNDNNGELYYTSQIHAIEGGHLPGEMGVGLYKYNTKNATWSALGGLPEKIRSGTYYTTFFWENSGQAPLTWFQNLQPSFTFDKSNRMHFALTINSNINLAGANRLMYAMSDDGGVTWKKVNGTRIPGLPLRAADKTLNQATLVADSGNASFFSPQVSVIADLNGKPGISVDNVWRTWDGSNWNMNNQQNFPSFPHANYGYLDPKGKLVLAVKSWPKILFASNFNSLSNGYDFPGYDTYLSIYAPELYNTGVIYGIGINLAKNYQAIIKTTVTPAPLPFGWDGTDITNTPSYGGLSGFLNKQFVITTYGTQIDNYNDSFYYVYKKMQGDGYLSAHINPVCIAAGCGSAGIMMRENLGSNSANVALQLGQLHTKLGYFFSFRSIVNGYTANIFTPGLTFPYWVKLVRTGDLFTGYISVDGMIWVQVGQTTVPMTQTIYIGLCSVSNYGHGFFMQTSTFDNVMAPVADKTQINY